MEKSKLSSAPIDFQNPAWGKWAAVLGFALGGFFDGILLHQILQWHHLMSLAPQELSLRSQILWDGYFHGLMYVLAVIALAGLFRSKQDRRKLIPYAMLGFGLWHLVDALLAHWILGIHRVRIDTEYPLFWDLAWLMIFGIIPLMLAWLLLRKRRAWPQGDRPDRKLWSILALITLGAAVWAMQPSPGRNYTAVVFAPHISAADRWNAVLQADARVAWSTPDMDIILVDMAEGKGSGLDFYRHGAMLVSGGSLPSGCISWAKNLSRSASS